MYSSDECIKESFSILLYRVTTTELNSTWIRAERCAAFCVTFFLPGAENHCECTALFPRFRGLCEIFTTEPKLNTLTGLIPTPIFTVYGDDVRNLVAHADEKKLHPLRERAIRDVTHIFGLFTEIRDKNIRLR